MSKILNKIKKLLALATSNNPNESFLALSKARELMKQHGITDEDLAISNIKEAAAFGTYGQKNKIYLMVLAEAIAKLFSCDHYYHFYWSKEKRKYINDIIFVGFNPNQEICQYCFDVLAGKLRKERKKYLYSFPKYNKYRIEKADAFAIGWAVAVLNKAKELVPPEPEIILSNNKTVIPINLIKKYIDDITSGKAKTTNDTNRFERDKLTGYFEGKKVEINKGMDFRERQLIK